MNLSDLKRAAAHADTVAGNPRTRLTDVHLRIRSARHRRMAAGAGAVAVAIALTGAMVGSSVLPDRAVAPAGPALTSGGSCTATPFGAADPGPVGFVGLPPVGAVPSTTKGAQLVLEWFGGVYTGKSKVWLYDDGRLITQVEGRPPGAPPDGIEGYVERCLSPSGVEAMHRYVLDTAVVKEAEPAYSAWLRVRPRESAALVELDHWSVDPHRLFEPETWLPAGDFVDRRYRPYVPTTYSVCLQASPGRGGVPDTLSRIPARAAEVLRPLAWASREPRHLCTTVPIALAREVVRYFDEDWFGPGYDGPPAQFAVGLSLRRTWNVTNADSGVALYAAVEPVLPDGQFTCTCG